MGGGPVLTGEQGWEIVDLPPGSVVHDHAASLRMLRTERRSPPPGGGDGGSAAVRHGGPLIERFEIHNHGKEPLQAKVQQMPNGNIRADFYPMGTAMIERAGRDGTLAKALNQTPRPIRR